MLTYSRATENDIRAYYGAVPGTIKAVCIKRDSEPVAMIGVSIERGQSKFFSENRMTDKERHTVTAWKAVKAAMGIVKKNITPVVALAECADGHKNLARLGFECVSGDIYRWVK